MEAQLPRQVWGGAGAEVLLIKRMMMAAVVATEAERETEGGEVQGVCVSEMGSIVIAYACVCAFF